MGANTTNTANTSATSGTTAANQTQSSQTVKDPYGAVLPALDTYSQLNSQYNNQMPVTLALNGLPGIQDPYTIGNSLLNSAPQGVTKNMQTPLAQMGQVASGQNQIGTGDLYSQIFNQAQPLAGNTSGALTDTQQAILDQNAERLSNRLASQYSGAGRYGSFGAGMGMARGIAETNNPLMAQYNQQNIGNSLAAMGVQQGAAGGLSNVQNQNIGNRMNAAQGQLGQYNQSIQNMQRQMAMQPALMNMAIAPSLAINQDLATQGNVFGAMAPYLANAGTVTNNSNMASTGLTNSNTIGTGQTSTPTPWTTYAGLGLAGIGAGSQLFGASDRRLKTDIKLLGKDPHTSLNMYEYRFKGFPKSSPKLVGPMAQEVQKKYPEAVIEGPGGILYLKGKAA